MYAYGNRGTLGLGAAQFTLNALRVDPFDLNAVIVTMHNGI